MLHFKIVVQILLNKNGLAGHQADLRSGRNGIGTAIGMDGDFRFIVNGLIGMGVIHPDQHIAAAPVDDILSFEPVEVVGRILTFF